MPRLQVMKPHQPSVGIVNLGCAKNTIDSESLLGLLLSNEFCFVSEPQEADLILINTCGFIQSAKEESIEHILEFIESAAQRPGQKIVVTGCLVERYGDELRRDISQIDGLLGLSSYGRILENCRRILQGEVVDSYGGEDSGIPEESPRLLLTGGAYAYLRISEGCDNHCTYCSVPSIRGKFRSRSMHHILHEAKTLIECGVQEICLVAQDPGNYGRDLSEGPCLPSLLRQLLLMSPTVWFRLLYMHPATMNSELLELLADEPQLLGYVDLPIQHINSRILKEMGRGYGRKDIELFIKKAERIPGLVLRTSLICGFPGETDAEFEELKTFISEGHFHHLGAFPFSAEEGTLACLMKNQIPARISAARVDSIMTSQQEVTFSWLDSRIGGQEEVLIDTLQDSGFLARSRCEAPEVDGAIFLAGREGFSAGDRVVACLEQRNDYDIIAIIK